MRSTSIKAFKTPGTSPEPLILFVTVLQECVHEHSKKVHFSDTRLNSYFWSEEVQQPVRVALTVT